MMILILFIQTSCMYYKFKSVFLFSSNFNSDFVMVQVVGEKCTAVNMFYVAILIVTTATLSCISTVCGSPPPGELISNYYTFCNWIFVLIFITGYNIFLFNIKLLHKSTNTPPTLTYITTFIILLLIS